MGTNKIKSLNLEQFKNKYEEVIPHLCYVDPRCEEYCHDAKDLTNYALYEIFDNYYNANNIPVEDCASYFRKISIHRKKYARVEPETIIDLIKDF